MEHAERYRRAREFYDVVTGLWDSWAEDAFIRNTETGEYFDPDRMHVLNHKGAYYSVRGPLNIARPIQGWPVIVQAGASDDGRQLAAETAEMIFAGTGNIDGARALLCRCEGPHGAARPRPRPSEDPARCLRRRRRLARRGAGEARRCSTAWCTTTAPSRRCRSRSAPMRRASIRMRTAARHPRNERQQERTRARHHPGAAGEPDGAPACAAARGLWRAGDSRHAGDDRRPDGGMADDGCLRRLQRHVPLSAGRAGRFRRSRGAGIAAARFVPARNTRARHCARTSACRVRRTGSSQTSVPEGLHVPPESRSFGGHLAGWH